MTGPGSQQAQNSPIHSSTDQYREVGIATEIRRPALGNRSQSESAFQGSRRIDPKSLTMLSVLARQQPQRSRLAIGSCHSRGLAWE